MSKPKTKETTFKFRLSSKQMQALAAYADENEMTKTEVLTNFIKSLPTYESVTRPPEKPI